MITFGDLADKVIDAQTADYVFIKNVIELFGNHVVM